MSSSAVFVEQSCIESISRDLQQIGLHERPKSMRTDHVIGKTRWDLLSSPDVCSTSAPLRPVASEQWGLGEREPGKALRCCVVSAKKRQGEIHFLKEWTWSGRQKSKACSCAHERETTTRFAWRDNDLEGHFLPIYVQRIAVPGGFRIMNSRLDRIEDWEALAKDAGYDPENLAALCLISLRQLERFFKSRFGKTPRVWLMALQCGHARELIQQGYSTQAAAYDTKFADASHLCHAFRREYGQPPQAFARLVLGGMSPADKNVALRQPFAVETEMLGDDNAHARINVTYENEHNKPHYYV